MENKNVGWLIIGIAIVMATMVLLFNNVISESIGLTCSHGTSCGMYTGVKVQTWISLSIIAVIVIIGLVIMFTKPKEKIVETVKYKTKTVTEKKKPLDLSGLDEKEKKAVDLIQEEGGMFQADLMEKIGIGKVGMTRLLDKLEAKQIVERKRRGMSNFVVLKN
jgi:uncharacterized membrane protein